MNLVRKNIQEIAGYKTEMFPKKWVLKLDGNENNIGASPKVIEAIKSVEQDDVRFYPAYGEILHKLAEKNGLSTDNYLVTNGCDEAISVVFNTVLTEKDKALSVSPSFVMPKQYAQIIGAEYIEIPYKQKWKYPVDDVLEAIDDSISLVHITSPNSPTGDIVSREDIEKVLNKAEKQVVILDETYSNYSDIRHTDLIEKYKNLVILRSFSKDYALAGLRLGYIVANPELILEFKKVISPYSVNNITLKAGIAALEDEEHLQMVKKEINDSKAELTEYFKGLGFVVYPSFSNFILVDFGVKGDFIYQKLKKNGIIVKYPVLNTCARVAIPPKKGVKLIKDALTVKDIIVFDMDGVLIDTGESYLKAIIDTVFDYTGQKITTKEIQEARNLGGLNCDWDMTQYFIEKYGKHIDRKEVVDAFQKKYWDDGKGLIKTEKLLINPDVIRKLSENFDIALFTGRPSQEALFSLNYFGIRDYFYSVITMDSLSEDEQKPNIKGIELIKQQMLYSDIYYLGDTIDDAVCAKNAKVHGVGVMPPQDKSDVLKNHFIQNGVFAVIENVNEIVKILEK